MSQVEATDPEAPAYQDNFMIMVCSNKQKRGEKKIIY